MSAEHLGGSPFVLVRSVSLDSGKRSMTQLGKSVVCRLRLDCSIPVVFQISSGSLALCAFGASACLRQSDLARCCRAVCNSET